MLLTLHKLTKDRGDEQMRKLILKHCNKNLIDAICEIALNIINGNIKINKKYFKKLKKHVKDLRFLCSSNNTRAKKKNLLISQCGGGGFANRNILRTLLDCFLHTHLGREILHTS